MSVRVANGSAPTPEASEGEHIETNASVLDSSDAVGGKHPMDAHPRIGRSALGATETGDVTGEEWHLYKHERYAQEDI